MGTNPEHVSSHGDDEQVTWIGRDRSIFDRVTPPEGPATQHDTPASGLRDPRLWRKWLLPASVVIIALLIASASFMLLGR